MTTYGDKSLNNKKGNGGNLYAQIPINTKPINIYNSDL